MFVKGAYPKIVPPQLALVSLPSTPIDMRMALLMHLKIKSVD
jgi:hypothetical protein